MLQRLIDARLLTASEATVEIAHEALIRAWPQLRDWLMKTAKACASSDTCAPRRTNGRGLVVIRASSRRGARLAATLDWVGDAHPALDDLDREYLDACRVAEEAELAAARESRDARPRAASGVCDRYLLSRPSCSSPRCSQDS